MCVLLLTFALGVGVLAVVDVVVVVVFVAIVDVVVSSARLSL